VPDLNSAPASASKPEFVVISFFYRSMKKLLLLLTTAAATTATSFAQAPTAQAMPDQVGTSKSVDQMAARRAQYLAKELSLSADQQARLQPVLLAQRQEMQAMRDKVQTGGRQRGMGQDLKASMTKYDAQVKGILTPEQYTKFSQLKDEQRDKMRERRQGGQGMATPSAQ
jgi:protein CpxP